MIRVLNGWKDFQGESEFKTWSFRGVQGPGIAWSSSRGIGGGGSVVGGRGVFSIPNGSPSGLVQLGGGGGFGGGGFGGGMSNVDCEE